MKPPFLATLLLAAHPALAQQLPVASIPPFEPVTWQRLVTAADEPWNWLMYSGTFDGQRFSRLDQINTGNTEQLELKWAYQIPTRDPAETTPLVVDGVMFITEPSNRVVALDATTGEQFWTYEHDLPDDLFICCGRHNRGVAILDDTLYMGTLDARLVAIDARSGEALWTAMVANHEDGYSTTAAPLVVKNQVITGVAGADFGIRGFLDAYNAQTGQRIWRTYTIPDPDDRAAQTWAGDSWRTGGSPTWLTGSYDPELDLLYWGTGNPAPRHYGEVRSGDNLYSDSALAIDPDSGQIEWHFQFTPHDVHHWDSNQIPVLADLAMGGTSQAAMLWANRNGFYYTLDRATGQFLLGRPFARQTWADGLDADGRPVRRSGMILPDPTGTVVSPPASGATNWMSPTYSPDTGLLYVMAFDGAGEFFGGGGYAERSAYIGGEEWLLPNDDNTSAVRAIDPSTGEWLWQYKVQPGTWSGLLATAGAVIFGGSADGYFYALHADTGDKLWRVPVVAPVRAAPISYAVEGQQYVTIAAGNVVYSFGLRTEDESQSPADQIQAHLATQLTSQDFDRAFAAWNTAVRIDAADMGREMRTALVAALNREHDNPRAEDDHYLVSLANKAMEIAGLSDRNAALSMLGALARYPVNSWELSELLVALGSPALCEVVKTASAPESSDFMRWGALSTLERFVDDMGRDTLAGVTLGDECWRSDSPRRDAGGEGTALELLREIAHVSLAESTGYLPLAGAIGLAVILADEQLRQVVEEFANNRRGRELGLNETLAADVQGIAAERLEELTPLWRRQ